MNKILILGSTGLLGVPLAAYLENNGCEVIRHSVSSKSDYQVDARDQDSILNMLEQIKPETIINLVSLTNVDKCEQEPNMAYSLNVLPVENLLPWLKKNNDVHLIHISTDQVYDSPGLSREADVSLKNIYGISKYFSEQVALRANATILRTNFFGKSLTPGRVSISDWLWDAFTEGKEIKLFTDVFFSPLSITTLSMMIHKAVIMKHGGVYNLGSHNGASKRDFAKLIAEAGGFSMKNTKDTSKSEMNLIAYRPSDMRMDSSLFEKAFKIKLPSLEDEVKSITEI